MYKLLIIADDLTGALDAGVQFAQRGIPTRVIPDKSSETDLSRPSSDEVLVINSDTRHLSESEAYKIIYNLSISAFKSGIKSIYKKTDSGLRGNIGAELEALLDASKEKTLAYIPSYPRMNRITVNGVYYIDGIPVSKSPFAVDLLNPVKTSSVNDLFQKGRAVNIERGGYRDSKAYQSPVIEIYDSETDEDIREILKFLESTGEVKVLAGCAGFATVLADSGRLTHTSVSKPKLDLPYYISCGSVHPVSQEQVRYAVNRGLKRIPLDPLDELQGTCTSEWLQLAERTYQSGENFIVDSGILELENIRSIIRKKNMDTVSVSQNISFALSWVTARLLRLPEPHLLMVIGGDTLMRTLMEFECTELTPVNEPTPGTVLSWFTLNGKKQWILTKSGGFGDKEQLHDLTARKHPVSL